MDTHQAFRTVSRAGWCAGSAALWPIAGTVSLTRWAVGETVGQLSVTAVDAALASPHAAVAARHIVDSRLAERIGDRVVARLEAAGAAQLLAEKLLAGGIAERLAARALEGPEIERIVDRALESPGVERMLTRILERRTPDVAHADRQRPGEGVWTSADELRARSRQAEPVLGHTG